MTKKFYYRLFSDVIDTQRSIEMTYVQNVTTIAHMKEEIIKLHHGFPYPVFYEFRLCDPEAEPLKDTDFILDTVIYIVTIEVELKFRFYSEKDSVKRTVRVKQRESHGLTINDLKELLYKKFCPTDKQLMFEIFDETHIGSHSLDSTFPLNPHVFYIIKRLPSLSNLNRKIPSKRKHLPTTGIIEEDLFPLPMNYSGNLQIYRHKDGNLYLKIKDMTADSTFKNLLPDISNHIMKVKAQRRKEQHYSKTRKFDVRLCK